MPYRISRRTSSLVWDPGSSGALRTSGDGRTNGPIDTFDPRTQPPAAGDWRNSAAKIYLCTCPMSGRYGRTASSQPIPDSTAPYRKRRHDPYRKVPRHTSSVITTHTGQYRPIPRASSQPVLNGTTPYRERTPARYGKTAESERGHKDASRVRESEGVRARQRQRQRQRQRLRQRHTYIQTEIYTNRYAEIDRQTVRQTDS